MADGVYPQVFGRSDQLLQNKVFDPSTSFMRKGRDGEEKKQEKKRMMKIVATNVVPVGPTGTPTARANCKLKMFYVFIVFISFP